MELTSYAGEVAARFMPAERAAGCVDLLVALLRELVKGYPVKRGALATTLGWPVDRLTALLAKEPCTECDDAGNVIGHGITLRETAHAFEVAGRRLYTWCALDALMFPVMISKTARVAEVVSVADGSRLGRLIVDQLTTGTAALRSDLLPQTCHAKP